MRPGRVAMKVSQILTQLTSIHLAKMTLEGYHLVTTELHCPTLVHSDVASSHSHHALVAPQHGVDHGAISLRAAHQEEHVGISAVRSLPDASAGILTKRILAISLHLGHVGLYKSIQNRRVRTLNVVAGK